MIKVDESDPVGELEPSFPYKDITIRRGVDMKEHYELQSEIGRGKFGTVFKCREKATGLMLAAKFIGIVHKQDRRNVEREVEIMCELQHPRLIQLYDAFEANKAMCCILELVEGGELFERVIGDDFVLTEKAVTIFMRQICEGVQFIHSKNILHLDLKPENILCLTKTGNRIKIIDFGLARKFNPDNKLQVLFGTPEFVAPEVVNFDAIGFGTDMWSVGVICYVLLSGLSPFMGETDVETMANVTIAQYDFDDEAFDSISNDAKDFIKKLLVKDHKSRPTATECLSHRWMQKKKTKKLIVRKNSSKTLLNLNDGNAKPITATPFNQDVLLVPLEVSKENLKELCSKSRSQSPAEISTVLPNLAQLRILKDSKSSCKTGNGDGLKTTINTDKTVTVGPLPPTGNKNNSDHGGLQSNLGIEHATTSRVQQALTSEVEQTTNSGVEQTTNSGVEQTTNSGVDQTTNFGVEHATTSYVQQATTSGIQQEKTSGTQQVINSHVQQAMTSGVQQAIPFQSPVGHERLREVTSTAAIEVPLRNSDNTTKWSMKKMTMTTNKNTNNHGRRASDISYMFSSFQTTCTTTSTAGMLQSSNFLQGTDIRGLSERLQDMQLTMFDDCPSVGPEIAAGNLHKLLLNRQQLSAAVQSDRKPKFKLSALNRDVPAGSPPPTSNLLYYMTTTSQSSSCRSAPHSKCASPEQESSSSACKEMLLKLFYGGGTGGATGENPVATESKLST